MILFSVLPNKPLFSFCIQLYTTCCLPAIVMHVPHFNNAGSYRPSLIQSATRSAIMMVVALVLARITSGITEASTTRKFSSP